MRPENYTELPKGVRCKCPALWRETDGGYWCCREFEKYHDPKENDVNDFYARGEHLPGVTQ